MGVAIPGRRGITLAALAALATLAVVLVACGGDDTRSGAVIVEDSAGVEIVLNSGPDRVLDWNVAKLADLVVPEPGLEPSPDQIGASLSRGEVYVLDGRAGRVLAFDSTGRFLREWGRSGSGPFELAGGAALSVQPDDAVAVLDARRQKVVRWTADGEPLNEAHVSQPYWGPGFADRGDALLFVRSRPSEDAPQDINQQLIEVRADSVRVLSTLVQRHRMVELPCMRRPMPRPFAPFIRWATADDDVLVAAWPDYRIDRYRGGEHVASIRRDAGPVEVTEAMAIEHIEHGYLQRVLQLCGITAETLLKELGLDSHIAPIEWIATDSLGRVWATRTSAGSDTTRVDIFEPNGEYAGTLVNVPRPVAFMSSRRFVAMTEDEFGVRLELWGIAER